jgi:DNA-binding MarR family transcriptional regulator
LIYTKLSTRIAIICIYSYITVYADIDLRSTAFLNELSVIMTEPIDIKEISNCTCLRARRVTRRLTQIYDAALEPVDITTNQFGVLSYLYGVTLGGRDHVSIGALAERIGKHPTTLNRDLKPLEMMGLVANVESPGDRRVRGIQITSKGRTHLRKAVTFWRQAQSRVRDELGPSSMAALNELLETTAVKLGGPS